MHYHIIIIIIIKIITIIMIIMIIIIMIIIIMIIIINCLTISMHLKNGIAGIKYKLQKFTLFNNAIDTILLL